MSEINFNDEFNSFNLVEQNNLLCELKQKDEKIKNLETKLENIKNCGYGSLREVEKKLRKYFDENETLSWGDISLILIDEMDKADNLCMMCDFTNEHVKQWAEINQLTEKLNFAEKALNTISSNNKCKCEYSIEHGCSSKNIAKQALEDIKGV